MVGEVQFRCEGWVGGLENEEQKWLKKCSVDVKDGFEVQKMKNRNGWKSVVQMQRMGWRSRKWRNLEYREAVKDWLDMQKMENQ